jgi:transmembrane sensor
MNEIGDEQIEEAEGRLEQAVEWFMRLRSDSARVEDLPELQRWIDSDSQNAVAYQQVCASWAAVGLHASAPEVVIGRRDALENARKAGRHHWTTCFARRPRIAQVAASAGMIVVLALGWWFVTAQHSSVYATEVSEQRTVTLQDGSVIAIDARSRVRVRYTDKERLVSLEQGQARFTVAKDPLRPFRVHVRDQTVVALGTQFDVELISENVLVTLIEGHIAVTGLEGGPLGAENGENRKYSNSTGSAATGEAERSTPREKDEKENSLLLVRRTVEPSSANLSSRSREGAGVVELTAGEGLRIHRDGRAVLVANINLDRIATWQSGKIFFDNEPLASAAERVNRYSRRRIEVDPSVATLGISGVFNTVDIDSFIEAITEYFPVKVDRKSDSEIHLTRQL